MQKIILIERYNQDSYFWPNLVKNKKITELSVGEILEKYQGFEGELLLMSILDKSTADSDEIYSEFLKINNQTDCLLLHVISDGNAQLFKNDLIQCGYDVGVCEEEKTIYSSIFNEILFGNLPELISYKNLLNKNLLLPNRSLAEEYVDLHNQLSVLGKGVEDYEEMTIYEIWKHPMQQLS